MRLKTSVSLILAALAAAPLCAQPSPEAGRKYRVFLDNGTFLEGTLRFDYAKGTAIVVLPIGRVTLPRDRVTGFVDPSTGHKYDWRDFVKTTDTTTPATTTPTTTTPTTTTPTTTTPTTTTPVEPVGPKPEELARMEKVLKAWANEGYTEKLKLVSDLKAIKDPPAPYLAENLKKMDPTAWVPAGESFIALGDSSITKTLSELLKEKASDLRLVAVRAMAFLSKEPDDYLGAMNDEDERIRLEVVSGLSRTNSAAFLRLLADLMVDPGREVRRRAAAALETMAATLDQKEEAAVMVSERLEQASLDRRDTLIESLSRLGTDGALIGLEPLLNSEVAAERVSAATALGAIKVAGARKILREALETQADDENPTLTLALMKSCEAQNDLRAVPLLIELLDSENSNIVTGAHKALEVITKRRGVQPKREPWEEWWKTQPPLSEEEGTP